MNASSCIRNIGLDFICPSTSFLRFISIVPALSITPGGAFLAIGFSDLEVGDFPPFIDEAFDERALELDAGRASSTP